LEYGVDTQYAVRAYQQGCPISRTIVAPFGRAVTALSDGENTSWIIPDGLTAGGAREWIDKTLARLEHDQPAPATAGDVQASGIREWLLSLGSRQPDV